MRCVAFSSTARGCPGALGPLARSAHQTPAGPDARLSGGWDAETGIPVEIQMDEVCLRTEPVVPDNGEILIRAIRYAGLVERGQAKVVLVELPGREVQAGGGSPISDEELWNLMAAERNNRGEVLRWRVRAGSVIHTDRAKAYFNLGWREAVLPTLDEERKASPAEKNAVRRERHELCESRAFLCGSSQKMCLWRHCSVGRSSRQQPSRQEGCGCSAGTRIGATPDCLSPAVPVPLTRERI